jgi:hypothetical protein
MNDAHQPAAFRHKLHRHAELAGIEKQTRSIFYRHCIGLIEIDVSLFMVLIHEGMTSLFQ